MDQAKIDIENKLVPKGAEVVRHLSLPSKGQTPEWILEEMEKMDTEVNGVSWKRGKLSGAVYRAAWFPALHVPPFICFRRWGRRTRESHRDRLPTVLRL